MPKQASVNSLGIKLGWLIFTSLVFLGLLKLSHWQYSRAIEKQQRLDKIARLEQSEPLALSDLSNLRQKRDENINDWPVTVSARFNNQLVFLLDNQVHQGQLGYRVLQLAINKQHAALVNLGWLKGSIDRSKLPSITPIEGSLNFHGNIRIVEQGISLQAQDYSQVTWPLRIQQIELNEIAKLIKGTIDVPLLPFVIYLDENEPFGYSKNWQPIVMPPEKHMGYAVQWLALAIAWLILMAWVSGVLRYLTLVLFANTRDQKGKYEHTFSKK